MSERAPRNGHEPAPSAEGRTTRPPAGGGRRHRRYRAAGHEPGGPDAGGRVAACDPGRREVTNRPADRRAEAAAQAVAAGQRDAQVAPPAPGSRTLRSLTSRPKHGVAGRPESPNVRGFRAGRPPTCREGGLNRVAEAERRCEPQGRAAGVWLGGGLVQPRAGPAQAMHAERIGIGRLRSIPSRRGCRVCLEAHRWGLRSDCFGNAKASRSWSREWTTAPLDDFGTVSD